MADIDVERKSGFPWLWVILGLLLLALIAWWLIPDEEEPVAVAPPVAEQGVVPANPPPPEPVVQGPFNTIASVLGNPSGVIGQTFAPAAPLRVAEVVSDRGFWVEDQGQRLFVVINEGAMPNAQPGVADVQGKQAEMPNVNAGDMIRITEGVIHDPTSLQHLQGPIEPETRRVLSGLQVFLITDGRNIQKM
ncbi:MAG TPA: hypothetical protein VGR37_02295 [Longimicrobiaceae bacterium]|nr:hypothetical protein [Longimicrobiaceae bacterium]